MSSKDREYRGLHVNVGSGRTQLSKNPWKILFSKVLTRPSPSDVYNPLLIQSHVALETAQGSEFQSSSSSSAFFLRSQRNFRKSPQLTLLTLLTLNQTRTSPRKPNLVLGAIQNLLAQKHMLPSAIDQERLKLSAEDAIEPSGN